MEGFFEDKNDRYYPLALQLKGQILAAQEKWQLAYETQIIFNLKHKQLDKKQLSKNTAEMRHKFDLDQIESENKKLLEYKHLKENEKLILEHNKQLQLIIFILAIIIIFYLAYSVYKQQQKARILEVLALTDHLTLLPNQRHIYQWAETTFQEAMLNNLPISIILFDADHFKKINDQLGHKRGDEALILLGRLSTSLMRKQDKVGRVGGEEFLVVLYDTPKEQALTIAQRLIEAVENTKDDQQYQDIKLTISAGVACLDEDKDFTSLLNRADKALYQAKAAGRNCAKLS